MMRWQNEQRRKERDRAQVGNPAYAAPSVVVYVDADHEAGDSDERPDALAGEEVVWAAVLILRERK